MQDRGWISIAIFKSKDPSKKHLFVAVFDDTNSLFSLINLIYTLSDIHNHYESPGCVVCETDNQYNGEDTIIVTWMIDQSLDIFSVYYGDEKTYNDKFKERMLSRLRESTSKPINNENCGCCLVKIQSITDLKGMITLK